MRYINLHFTYLLYLLCVIRNDIR